MRPKKHNDCGNSLTRYVNIVSVFRCPGKVRKPFSVFKQFYFWISKIFNFSGASPLLSILIFYNCRKVSHWLAHVGLVRASALDQAWLYSSCPLWWPWAEDDCQRKFNFVKAQLCGLYVKDDSSEKWLEKILHQRNTNSNHGLRWGCMHDWPIRRDNALKCHEPIRVHSLLAKVRKR